MIAKTPVKLITVTLLILSLFLLINVALIAQQKQKNKSSNPAIAWAPDELLVGFSSQTSGMEKASAHKAVGASVMKRYKSVPVHRIRQPKGMSLKEAIKAYKSIPGVRFAEPNYIVSIPKPVKEKTKINNSTSANDPDFALLWGLHNSGQNGGTVDADIDAPEAWDITTGSPDVIVAIIDTGVDYNHPDLAANMWTNTAELNGSPGVDDDNNGFVDDIHGYDFVNDDGDPMDDQYHGTHVAGTIGAVGNNSYGVTGVAWNVKIMALKFLDSGGSGYTSAAIDCVEYATLMGAHLTSNSWGGGGFSQALKDAIEANATLFVAAAGNDSSDNDSYPHYPSSYESPNILSVMSTDNKDLLSSFSNYGRTSVDVAAPGTGIYSTAPGNSYKTLSGTSMATPHVAGLAALLLADNPALNTEELKLRIMLSGDAKASLSGRSLMSNRINAYNALTYTPSTGSLKVTISPPEAVAAGAMWSYDISGQWYNSGETATGVPTGTRSVYFTSIQDWGKPGALAVTISQDQLSEAEGQYFAVWPGPDSFGYVGYTTTVESFEDIESTGSSISFPDNDDSAADIPIGFDFSYYGQNYSSLSVFTNGGISFDPGAFADYTNNPLPDSGSPALFLAPWWEDLYLAGNNYVKYQVLGSAPDRRIIIQWYTSNYDWSEQNHSVKFQVKLYETSGRIVFAYDDVEFGDSSSDNGKLASIGIQNADGSAGLQYGYYGSREPSTDFAIVFSTSQAATGSLQVNITPQGAVDAGAKWSHNLTSQWYNSGQTINNISAESLTISFKDLNGWETPADVSTTVAEGLTTTESAAYTYIPNGNLRVDILPAEAIEAGAMWKLVGTDTWRESGTNIEYLPAGSYTVTFNDVYFWEEPADIPVTVIDAELATAEGTYVPSPSGSVTVDITPSEAVDAGAAWSWLPESAGAGALKNPITWYQSGTTQTTEVGQIKIIYKPLLGWSEPAEATVTVTDGSSETITADYKSSNTTNVWPGPEAYGYQGELDTAGFEDISATGTSGVLDDSDDGSFELPLGFDFPFYPQNSSSSSAGRLQDHNKVHVCSNGFISLEPSYSYSNLPLPNSNAPGPLLAPYWDDLILNSGDSIKYELRGTAPERRMIIQWKVHHYSEYPDPVEFQAILFESGRIEFHYKNVLFDQYGGSVNNGGSATIGIQSSGATSGLQYCFNGSASINNDDSIIITRQDVRESSLTVTITPAEVQSSAGWKLAEAGSVWHGHGETVSGLFEGSTANIIFKDIDNYIAPAIQAVTLVNGENTASGEYLAAGYLTVNISPAEAVSMGGQWRRVGTSAWLNSGTSEKVVTGSYSVEFRSIASWDAPAAQDVTITAANITTVSGSYIPQLGSLKVGIAPQAAIDAGAQWRRYGTTTWLNSGETETDILAGSYYVEFKATPGWGAPANQAVTISKDTLTDPGTFTYTSRTIVTSVPGMTAFPGDLINVDVSINYGDGIDNFAFYLSFDPRYLTFVEPIQKGNLVDNTFLFGGGLHDSSTVVVSAFSDFGSYLYNGPGTLARITFRVAADAPDETVIPLILSNFQNDLSISTASNGSITIVLDCENNLDINGDGFVTPGDALMVLKHYLGTERLTDACQLKKADANGDDAITPGDALIILQTYLGI